MALNIQDARILIKRSTNTGEVPTAAPSNDHTDGTWDALDIYTGELFLNVADSRAWFRSNTAIIELATLNGPTDAFVNGGNAFGSTAVFGLSDDNQVDFKANNITVFSYDKNGVTLKTAKPIYFQDSGGTNTVDISAPTTLSGSYSLNLPTAQGSADTYLKNDGSGNLSWSTVTGSGGLKFGNTSGTDTYTVTIAGVTGYNDGDAYLISFSNGNTVAGPTLNINGLGAVTLYRNNDGQLLGGDIQANGTMLCVYDSGSSVFQCIGTSPNTLFAYVTNGDSSTITKGQPVYAFSGTGDRMVVKLANNTSDATSARTIGLVYSTSIAANQKGLIIIEGLLDGLSTLPTSTWADGDIVYLGATAGAITKTKPTAPNHMVYLGTVTTASAGSAGRMYVKVQNGYEMSEIHDYQEGSVQNNQVITYESSSSLYKPKSISTILGYTPANAAETPKILLKNSTDASTSSTTYTLLYSGLIPANTFAVGDMFYFEITYRKTGTAGTGNHRVYLNTSSTLTGATQIAQKVTDAATNLYGKFARTPIIKSSTNTEIIIATNNLNTDLTNVNNAASTLNINWTVDQYFLVGVSVAVATDTSILSGVLVKKL